MKSKELRQKRHKIVVDMRAIIDLADKEKRGLTDEEQQKYDTMFADVDKLKTEIETEERQTALEAEVADSVQDIEDRSVKPEPDKTDQADADLPKTFWDTPEYRSYFDRIIRGGSPQMSVTPEIEKRALQADIDIYGGYLVTPVQFVNDLIKAKDNMVFIRKLAKKHSLPKAESLGSPALDNDPADPEWTPEIGQSSEDSTMSFGKREFTPHALTKLIRVSEKLVRSSYMDVPGFVRDRLAYKYAVTEENAFLNGNGSQQPLGVFTASSEAGISTSRDISTGNTTTEIRVDGLKRAKYSLPSQYRNSPSIAWVFHRDAVSLISRLKDGMGRYLWQDSIVIGEPDRLLSYPVYESEYCPNTFTTGLYVGILGDWEYYWIVDALDMNIKVLLELYSRTNEIGYQGRQETDGMPAMEAPFARITLA